MMLVSNSLVSMIIGLPLLLGFHGNGDMCFRFHDDGANTSLGCQGIDANCVVFAQIV